MEHSEIEELLSACVDGELTPAQQEMVDLHLAGCPDCQRSLAEFRLTRQQLALLADPVALTWRPDVVERVTARVRRRRRWWGIGRRLALDLAGVLAVGLVVAAAIWLLPRLLTTSPDETTLVSAPPRTTYQPTPSAIPLPTPTGGQVNSPSPPPPPVLAGGQSGDVLTRTPAPFMPTGAPADVTYVALVVPGSRTRLQISSAHLLRGRPVSNAVQNLGFQLFLDDEALAKEAFIVLEGPDGAQTFLDPAKAPSILVPAGVQAGDSLRLFLWLRDGDHSPTVEFALERDAAGNWLAVNPQQVDAPSSLRVALPQTEASQSTYMALKAPDDEFVLHLFDADALRETPASSAVRNLGYRLSADTSSSAFAVVEVVDGEQIILDPDAAPSIYLPSGIQPGDQVRLFAVAPDGTATSAAEFTLASVEGWQALDLRPSAASVEMRVKLPTPTPQVVDTGSYSPGTKGPEVVLHLERLYVTPEQPLQGQPFAVVAIIRNEGQVTARVPVWFGAFVHARDVPDAPRVRTSFGPVTIPAGKEIELTWDSREGWEWGIGLNDLVMENSRLIFYAGVNVHYAQTMNSGLLPEADKRDNVAEISVDFLPYQPLVSDDCPPGENLWLEMGEPRVGLSYSQQRVLPVIVHNEGNVEVTRVALRVSDADGQRFLTYARWMLPCGGTATVDIGRFAGQYAYPITITLNPTNVPGVLFEADRGDNVLVVSKDETCAGPTDLWISAEDVAFEGDDLLVTVHLAGSLPGSFWVRAYYTGDGHVIADRQVSSMTCGEPKTLRFEGALEGLSGGAVMVQIDTEPSRIERTYPQYNNTATVPLP
jgi:hypothetical protein